MDFRKDFPLIVNSKVVYLDSAATTQKPKKVIEAIKNFYDLTNANSHSGLYDLSQRSSEMYDLARKTVAEFINANVEEIIFTRGSTEGINLIAHSLPKILRGKNNIVVTELEHHSNFVPWQQLAKDKDYSLKVMGIDSKFEISDEELNKIDKNTGVVAITHVSNSLGAIQDIKKIIEIAHKNGAIVVVDASQSIQHIRLDVKELDCDFLVFSGHKVYGPMGIGVMYGKKRILEEMPPFLYGGDMIESVDIKETTFAKIPKKFEAGTQNISGAIGLMEAIKYVRDNFEDISRQENDLLIYAIEKLSKIPGIVMYSPKHNAGVISFNIPPIHPHDMASLLNDYGVAVRAGHHCTMILMNKISPSGTVRISLACYNTREDIDKLVNALNKILEIFK